MTIEKMIDQIVSIKDNAESFTTKDGDDEIWRADIKVCEEMIAILSALQDAGVNTSQEAYTVAKTLKVYRGREAAKINEARRQRHTLATRKEVMEQ